MEAADSVVDTATQWGSGCILMLLTDSLNSTSYRIHEAIFLFPCINQMFSF